MNDLRLTQRNVAFWRVGAKLDLISPSDDKYQSYSASVDVDAIQAKSSPPIMNSGVGIRTAVPVRCSERKKRSYKLDRDWGAYSQCADVQPMITLEK